MEAKSEDSNNDEDEDLRLKSSMVLGAEFEEDPEVEV
jgi:hypothetical protein